MRLREEPLLQLRGSARLAEAGFAGDKHDLAVSRLRTHPAPKQQMNFLVTADQWAQCRSAQRLEPALDDAGTKHLPGRHRRGDALDLEGAQITVLEQIANQPASACANDDGIWLGQSLQTNITVSRRRSASAGAGAVALAALSATTADRSLR